MFPTNRRAGLWLPSVLAALAFAAGCARTGGEASADGREAAVAFLDELRAGRVEEAWQGSSPEFKSLMGLDSLRDSVKRNPALRSSARHEKSIALGREGRTEFEHIFQGATTHRGKTTPATIKVLVSSWDDGWKVERLSVE